MFRAVGRGSQQNLRYVAIAYKVIFFLAKSKETSVPQPGGPQARLHFMTP
jgi:hypothetical protein